MKEILSEAQRQTYTTFGFIKEYVDDCQAQTDLFLQQKPAGVCTAINDRLNNKIFHCNTIIGKLMALINSVSFQPYSLSSG